MKCFSNDTDADRFVDMSERRAEIIRQLRAERNDLYDQLRRVDDALMALGALSARDESTLPGAENRMTLQGRIRVLMEEQDKAWNAAGIVEALQQEGFVGLNVDDPVPGVRTSFVRLKDKGHIVNTTVGWYRAKKWVAADVDDSWETSDEPMTEDELRAMIAEEDATNRHTGATYDPNEEPF